MSPPPLSGSHPSVQGGRLLARTRLTLPRVHTACRPPHSEQTRLLELSTIHLRSSKLPRVDIFWALLKVPNYKVSKDPLGLEKIP